jgi:Cu(I)/Ag(I) efflux system membrane fusion protein
MNERDTTDPHAAPRGARTMNLVRLVFLIALALVAVLSIGSYVMSRSGMGSKTAAVAEAQYYCPMHPTYTSDRPGECPICSMSLEPIPEAGAGGHDAAGSGNVPGLVGVHIESERIQKIGVRTAVAEMRPLGPSLDLVAFVAPDESRMKQVQLRVAGWVRELNISRTGESVRAGQPLLSIYSPELFQSEREFLIELEGASSLTGGDSEMHHEAGALASARQRLVLLGVPSEEIARLERERKAETRLTLRSPVTGTVLERGVTEGQYVGPSTTLLTLADLSRVWLLVDLYEQDLPRVRAGDKATFTADGLPGKSFEGTVEFLYPTVSPETRTVKARIAMANPGGDLRPGMFGRVKLLTRGEALLTVPTEAIIHTGEHDYVFISHESGHFEPRMVWVGRSDSDRTEVRRGLAEGEVVVASASFMIDSESRLRAAISGAGAPAAGHQH